MSNEYKDYIIDQIQEVLIEKGIMDKITKVVQNSEFYEYDASAFVYGIKDNKEIKLEMWFDPVQCEWHYKRSED